MKGIWWLCIKCRNIKTAYTTQKLRFIKRLTYYAKC